MIVSERCYETIAPSDLRRLTAVVFERLADVYARTPILGVFRGKLRAMCLAQGGALHVLDRSNGLKDFDVWCFFSRVKNHSFPHRTIWNADFGPSKFGRHPDDQGYTGRRIDVIGRSLNFTSEDAAQGICKWLRTNGVSPTMLRRKAMIGLWPDDLFMQQLWPEKPTEHEAGGSPQTASV